MRTPHESRVVTSISLLQAAKSAGDIAAAATELSEGMGLDRYVIVDVRGNVIAGLHHNAPAHLAQQICELAWLSADPIAARLRRPIPVIWGREDGGPWRSQHGVDGYRSGVAAASWDASDTGCMVFLSCGDEMLPDEHTPLFLAYSLTAAAMATAPLKQLAAIARAPCPLSERELRCLQYASAGFSSKETAHALGISLRTVGQYLERARAKLQVKTSGAAAAIAIRSGWLDAQEAIDLAA